MKFQKNFISVIAFNRLELNWPNKMIDDVCDDLGTSLKRQRSEYEVTIELEIKLNE